MSDITIATMKAMADVHAKQYAGFDVERFMAWFSCLTLGQRRFWIGRGVAKANKSRRMNDAALRYMHD